MLGPGTLLPRANAAACPQLAKADFASSSRHAREGQRITEVKARCAAGQALALGAQPIASKGPEGALNLSGLAYISQSARHRQTSPLLPTGAADG